MYVELIVATIAAWVWLLTIDGPANTVALQTMFVCSFSTVLINANPLMRFDGYYILSDILDEPNLRGRADGIAEARLYRWILGWSTVPIAKIAGNAYGHLLCMFSWLGWFYRAGLSLAIAGLLVSIYDSWNVAWIGRLIAVLILISWWGIPSAKLAKNLIQMAAKAKKAWRLAFVIAIFVGCVGLLPVPYRQFGSGWLQPESMRGVYASATGILEYSVARPPSGSSVAEDSHLFSIHDMDAFQDVIRAEGMLKGAKAEFEAQQQAQSSQLEASKATVKTAEERFHAALAELEKRRLKAPCGGRLVIMPAPLPPGPFSHEADSLKQDWDSPTQAGRLIPKGTMLATICGSRRVAVIPLSDSQLEWVFSGTEVRLSCVERVAELYTCKVDKVVALEDVSATWRLMNGDLADAVPNDPGSSKGRNRGTAAYAAQVTLPEGALGSVGAKMDAVFVAPSQTVGSLGYRWLQQNLRWLAD
jgi:putative peptide zinc metalloprotease protein